MNDTDAIFTYAIELTDFTKYLLTHNLGDDACDDLDGCITMLDLCSRALRSDARDESCSILMRSFRNDAPTHPHRARPNDFDDIYLESYHDIAADTPRPSALPDED